jgi:phage terminase large subunit-like protein
VKRDNQYPSFTNVRLTKKSKTLGADAVKLYASTGQNLMTWQQIQIKSIMMVNPSGSWKYMNYCIGLSRRNGKGEVLASREMYGLIHKKEKILHTAHRTTTSHDAFNRLYTLLKKAGYLEHSKKKKVMPPKSFFASKQYGLEHIEISDGGVIDFRTRTDNGGLGEGFDLLVIDEAQEYTSKQESALLYTVSASKNPQTIMVGTPPTASSHGDVFVRIREAVLNKKAPETGWAEWSTPELVEGDKLYDPKLWKKYNPSYGKLLNDRKIRNEITGNDLDFNIQRLGFWCTFNQKSEISEADWNVMKVDSMPELQDQRFVGIKYGKDGVNVSMSFAARTKDGKIFVESIACESQRNGNGWIFEFLYNPKISKIAIDGASGQMILADQMKQHGIKKPPILPKVGEIITANAMFEQAVFSKELVHRGQKSLTDSVTNCEKRLIGSQGGFGYKSIVDIYDISLMDSAILAFWLCATTKEAKKKQSISF